MPSIFRVYTGADGQSHLAEEPLALQSFVDSEGAYGEGTPLQGATGITFRLAPPGYILSWHCAPRRQYTITLSEAAERPPGARVWLDADACRGAIKELVFRMSRRRQGPVSLVANRPIHLPPASLATLVRVAPEPDEVDRYIVEHVAPHDLVITAD